MSLRARIRSLRDDEQGFAIILAVALITLITIVSLSLMALTQGEDSHSRRDLAQDGAYQAAEAGTNAYLADLTQNVNFSNGSLPTSYMAKGEATRTDSLNNTHANPCTDPPQAAIDQCSDLAWTSGATWSYKTAPASDTGWWTVVTPGANTSQEYQYLIQVTPQNLALTGLSQQLTRIDVTGRPYGSTDISKWRTIETIIKPAALTDFQAFLATSQSYGATAVTKGQIFVGQDNSVPPVAGNLTHDGTAYANLYAQGTVGGSTTLMSGAKRYDSTTSPTALCKVNNCSPVSFQSFASTISTVKTAAQAGGIVLNATDPGNSSLSSPYNVDAWKLVFNSNGTVSISSCVKNGSTQVYDGTNLTSSGPVCHSTTTFPTPVSTLTPAKFPIWSAVDVIVSGTVHGTVTVASMADIVYGGPTNYLADGADVLGLEATNNIYIPPWALDASGNITLYSAQFALNGSFTQDPNCTNYTNNSNTCHAASTTCNPAAACTMTFYGSSALYGGSNGPIYMSNQFKTRSYNYDQYLLSVPPPFFPQLPNAFTILAQRVL